MHYALYTYIAISLHHMDRYIHREPIVYRLVFMLHFMSH